MKRAASLAMAATGPGSNPASRAEPDRNADPGMNRISGVVAFGAATGTGHLAVAETFALVGAGGAGATGAGEQPDRTVAGSARTATMATAGGARRILALH
jgi:hypothetical protein